MPIEFKTAAAQIASKANDPSRWCVAVEMPHGLVAWATYHGKENLGHGIDEGITVDESLRRALRRVPEPDHRFDPPSATYESYEDWIDNLDRPAER